MNLEELTPEQIKLMGKDKLIELAKLVAREKKACERNKLDLYQPHDRGEDGGQVAYHKAVTSHKIRMLITGNRFGKCLSYHTLIENPDGSPRKIGEIKGEHYVWAWDGEKRVKVLAEEPFKKGHEDCYRVWMADGQWFECAGNHRVLSKDGWQFFETIRESFPCLPPSSSEHDLITHVEDVRRLLRKPEDLMGGYSEDLHRYDERLLSLKDTGRVILPSLGDARQRNLLLLHLDALIYKYTNILRLIRDRLSILGALDRILVLFFDSLCYTPCTDGILDLHGNRIVQQPSIVEASYSRSNPLASQYQYASSSPLVSPDNTGNHIIAYQPIGSKDIYDFTVPVYHNYITAGVIHHNSTAVVVDALWLLLGIHPYIDYAKYPQFLPPVRVKMYADSYPMVEENIRLKIEEWLPDMYLPAKRPYITNQQGMLTGVNFKNGSLLKVGSYDQETRKAEGSNWHGIYMDEPPPRSLYVANMRGLVDFGGIMSISATPLSEAWMYDDLWEPGLSGKKKYIKCIRGKSSDNPHTDEQALELFLDELTDEEKEVRYFGKFMTLKGLVIDTYRAELSDIDDFDLDEDFVIYEGIDPHPKKPNAVLWKAVNSEGLRFIVRAEKFDLDMYDTGIEIAKIRQDLTQNGARIVKSVVDSSANQSQRDSGFKINLLQELKNGLRDAGEKVMPDVAQKRDWLLPGIKKLRDLYRPVRHDIDGLRDRFAPGNITLSADKLHDSDTNNNTKSSTLKELYGDKAMPMQYVFIVAAAGYKYELLHYQWPKDALNVTKPVPKHDEFIDCDRYIESVAPRYHTPGSTIVRSSNKTAYKRTPKSMRK